MDAASPDRARGGQRGISRRSRAPARDAGRRRGRRLGRGRDRCRGSGERAPARRHADGLPHAGAGRHPGHGPGHGGSARSCRRRADGVRGRRRARGARRGRSGRLPHEGPGARGDRGRHPPGCRSRRLNLTAENTAIVLDSTADLPDAADRFPNWRVVPLYVRFGDESLRDGVDIDDAEFYERLRGSTVFPTTSQPTPGDFLACYEELGRYQRIFSLHVSARVSGTFASAETAATEFGDGRVRAIDTETASASIAMLALAIQRRLERGTSDEEVDA